MWTTINGIFSSSDGQNVWVNLASDGVWHQVATGAPDGVTNVLVVLTTAKVNGLQVYVVLDGANKVTQAYI